MKILFIAPVITKYKIISGGAVTHISGVLKAFLKLGYNVDILIPDDWDWIPNGVNKIIFRPKGTMLKHTLGRYFYDHAIFEAFKDNFKNYDLIYQRHDPFFVLSKIIKENKILAPYFLEYNGSSKWILKNWGSNKTKRLLSWPLGKLLDSTENNALKYSDKVFVVADAMLSFIKKEFHTKITVNPNGVDVDRFTNLQEDLELKKKLNIVGNIIVGFVGTFHIWHGSEVLAKSIKQVLAKNKNVKFLFIGDGLMLPKVKEIVFTSGVEKNVIFTGMINPKDMPNHLSVCDILVNPTVPNPDGSEFFGSPTKLFEYLASGKSVISSKLGQMEDILEGDKEVLFVEGGNENDLAEKILILANDSKLRERLGKAGRKKVLEKYTWDANVDRILSQVKTR